MCDCIAKPLFLSENGRTGDLIGVHDVCITSNNHAFPQFDEVVPRVGTVRRANPHLMDS